MHFGVYPVVLDGFAQYGSAQADPTIMARKMRRAGRGARRWNASIIICERRAATQRSGQLRITMPERVARAQPQAAASRWLADSIRSNAAAQQAQARAQAGDRRRERSRSTIAQNGVSRKEIYIWKRQASAALTRNTYWQASAAFQAVSQFRRGPPSLMSFILQLLSLD